MADKLPKEVSSYFGLPEDADLDALKTHHAENYLKRSEAQSDKKLMETVMGKTMGSERTAIRKEFKTIGIDLEPKDIEGKNPSEIIAIGLSQAVSNFEASQKDLQGKVGQSVEDATKELKEKYDRAEAKAKDFKTKFETLGTDFESYKTNEKASRKTEKIEDRFKTAFAKVPKRTNLTDLEVEGFEAHLRKNFKIDFEEDGSEFITDIKGERIKNPNKAGSTYSVEELFTHVATEKNIVPKNDQQGKRTFNLNQSGTNENGNNGGQQQAPAFPARKLNHRVKTS